MDFISGPLDDTSIVMNPPSAVDRHAVLGNMVPVPPPAGPERYRYSPPPSRAPPNAIAIFARGSRRLLSHRDVEKAYTVAMEGFPWPPMKLESLNHFTKHLRSMEDAIDAKIEMILENPTTKSSTQLRRVERFKLPGCPQCWEEFFWVLGYRFDMICTDVWILHMLSQQAMEKML